MMLTNYTSISSQFEVFLKYFQRTANQLSAISNPPQRVLEVKNGRD